MVRKEWKSLNGLWRLSLDTGPATVKPYPTAPSLDREILVPFPIESALSGVMRPAEYATYRRTFTIPTGWRDRRVLLHFGAVDWECSVFVNGSERARHRGGFDPFWCDITDSLKPDGPQELVVRVHDPTDAGDQPRGKQVKKHGGIFYTSSTGIWQSVWIEPVPAPGILSLAISPDVDRSDVEVTVRESLATAPDDEVEVTVWDGRREVGRQTRRWTDTPSPVPVPNPKLWSPEHPFLYGLTVRLKRDGVTRDEVTSYFGMRKVELKSDGKVQRIHLNGKPVFMVGTLDQGFWPDGLYTAPTDEALRYDIEVTKRLGFNTIRKHVKVEPERWYYWADKLGVLVWQDMPAGDNKAPESRQQFEDELVRMVGTHNNHPSIMMWVVFNEGWGQHDTERLTGLVKRIDPTRIVNNASGWTDMKVGDVIDMHKYPDPGSPAPEPDRAAVLGEFGGLGLPIPGHLWSESNWGYQRIRDREALTRRYEDLLRHVFQLKEAPGLNAAIYTQITDVETETNGLLTYDRAVIKPDLKRVAAANRGDFTLAPPPTKIVPVVPTARDAPSVWRYTTSTPGGEWFAPGFDDHVWQEGPAGFGTEGTPGAVVRTAWNTPDVWVRREFTLPTVSEDLMLMVHHDEDAEVYLNGVPAARLSGYTSDYEEVPLTRQVRSALKAGTNVIAIHCHQTGGGQYIDAGLVRAERVGK